MVIGTMVGMENVLVGTFFPLCILPQAELTEFLSGLPFPRMSVKYSHSLASISGH